MQSADKTRLRDALLQQRRSHSDADIAEARAAIRCHVESRQGVWTSVAAYVPLRTEPGSVELLDALDGAGIAVLVPVLLPNCDLDWRRWPDGPLAGVDAIGTVDVAFVPALAVARDGTRLGRGGGSYDRALTRRSPDATVIALLFDDELVDVLPREPWDVPVHGAVTPSGWRVVRESGGPQRGWQS